MRDLKRNQISVEYALYLGNAELTDGNGCATGEFAPKYGDKTALMISVSSNKAVFALPVIRVAHAERHTQYALFVKLLDYFFGRDQSSSSFSQTAFPSSPSVASGSPTRSFIAST